MDGLADHRQLMTKLGSDIMKLLVDQPVAGLSLGGGEALPMGGLSGQQRSILFDELLHGIASGHTSLMLTNMAHGRGQPPTDNEPDGYANGQTNE
jgi:hypothetical protein